MRKKILYLFSDTGGGHRSAASALISAVQKVSPKEISQDMVDVFAECSGFLNIFARLYAPVIRYSPQFWGRLYYWLDDWKKLETLQKISSPFILEELKKLISLKSPDVIVSVHPMVNHLAFEACRQLGKQIPIITVVMDPVTFHKSWICPDISLLIVATEQAKIMAEKYGMDRARIKVLGIPIDPRFLEKNSKEKLRQEMGLDKKTFTILLMGGGEGSGGIFEIVAALEKEELKAQLIVVCGRNSSLKKRLENARLKMKARIFGFTNDVPAIMDASDIIVTKAGPGSIAEAISKDLPMIITSWLPGQEEGNVEFVSQENIGKIEKDPKKVALLVKKMLESPEEQEMRARIKKIAKPHAALDIAKVILSYL
ncbi:MAG: glycosyltransferase [Candidatus Margulisbacteria bacterium]|nr:glycosyltransferase [Candidatus Margulisiibacteriota bacterium]